MGDNNTTMIQDKDGSVYAVPAEHVQEALQSGGKLVTQVTDKDSSKYWVPLDSVHDALKSGATLTPPSIPSPAQPMQTDALGSMYGAVTGADAGTPTGQVQVKSGDQTRTVIAPKPGESFQDTMTRAREQAQQHPEDVQKSVQGAQDLGTGFVKSVGQTLKTAGDASPMGQIASAVAPDVSQAMDQSLKPNNEDQQAGQNVETVLEFVAGDEALKALSTSEKLSQLGKVGKFMESNPRIAQIVGDAIRTGTVGGTVGGIHHGAEGAVEGAIGGAVLGGATSAAGEIPGLMSEGKSMVEDILAKRSSAPLVSAEPDLPASTVAPTGAVDQPNPITKIFKGEQAAQPEVQGALRQSATSMAKDAGAEAAPESQGIRTLLDEPISNIATKERGLYDSINQASGTDLKSLYEHAQDIQEALDDPIQIANKSALQKEMIQTQRAIKLGEKAATDNGVPLSTLQDAKDLTQQKYAQMELKKKVFNNESVVQGNAAYGIDEKVNVDAAIRNAENLNKPSKYAPEGSPTRLQQAFGSKEGADKFLQDLYNAKKSGIKYMSQQTWAKRLATLGALGLAGKLGAHLLQ